MLRPLPVELVHQRALEHLAAMPRDQAGDALVNYENMPGKERLAILVAVLRGVSLEYDAATGQVFDPNARETPSDNSRVRRRR